MKLLVDTHALLWLVEGIPKLSVPARAAIADPHNALFLSLASIWELAVKIGNNKLKLSDPLEMYINKWTPIYQIALLPILVPHALGVVSLSNHHRDPFDRMLLSQSRLEGLTLVSADAKLAAYGLPILW